MTTPPARATHTTEKRAAADETLSIRHNLNRSDIQVEVWAENVGASFRASVWVEDNNNVTVRMYGPERNVKVTVSEPPPTPEVGPR